MNVKLNENNGFIKQECIFYVIINISVSILISEHEIEQNLTIK